MINLSNNFVFIMLIIVCLLILFYVYDNFILKNSCENIYKKIDNDNDKDIALEYINYNNYRYNKRPIDNYRLGSIYDFILHDNNMANEYYLRALQQVSYNNNFNKENAYIRDRLADRIRVNRNVEEDDNKLNIDNIHNIENELRELEVKFYDSLKKKDAPKKIEDKVIWKSDTQNVHDSAINNQIKKELELIEMHNTGNNNYKWKMPEIIRYVSNCQSDVGTLDRDNIAPAKDMLNKISHNKSYVTKARKDVSKITEEVFSYIMSHEGQKRKDMTENFLLNLKEAYKGGHPVCVTGQVTRILSSISDVEEKGDVPGLGVLKSKPVIKNEILMKAGHTRNKVYDEASEEVKEQYNKGKSNDDVKKLEQDMKNAINKMIEDDYKEHDESDPKWINNIKQEIFSCI